MLYDTINRIGYFIKTEPSVLQLLTSVPMLAVNIDKTAIIKQIATGKSSLLVVASVAVVQHATMHIDDFSASKFVVS